MILNDNEPFNMDVYANWFTDNVWLGRFEKNVLRIKLEYFIHISQWQDTRTYANVIIQQVSANAGNLDIYACWVSKSGFRSMQNTYM